MSEYKYKINWDASIEAIRSASPYPDENNYVVIEMIIKAIEELREHLESKLNK